MTSTGESITIMLVDDHDILMDAIQAVLEKEGQFSVIGRANSCAEVTAVLPSTTPDVIVLDLSLADCHGNELIPQIRNISPNTSIVILSIDSSIQTIQKSFTLGARGYLLKNSGMSRLFECIRKVHAGELYADGYVSETILKYVKIPDADASETDIEIYNTLSSREREVLSYMADGLSTKEIASELGISPKTVETHRQKLYSKLNIYQPIDLARFAIRIGIINPDVWRKLL